MDSELEKLKAQKKELERQIAALKKNSQICGYVKLDKDHYATSKRDEWYVAVFQEYYSEYDIHRRRETGRWRSIIRNPDKKVVVSKIDDVIADLQGLKAKLKESEDE